MIVFDERYDIRLAREDEIDDIRNFIKMYWNENHIFVKDRQFFKWMYGRDDSFFNFMIARERSDSSLQAIWGFVLSSLTEGDTPDVSGSMWKVRPDNKNIPLFGCELINRLPKFVKYRDHLGSGLNPKTAVPFYKSYFNRFVEKMRHYYILNATISDYKIAKIPDTYQRKQRNKKEKSLQIEEIPDIAKLKSFFDLMSCDRVPHKDAKYLYKRYFTHPYY